MSALESAATIAADFETIVRDEVRATITTGKLEVPLQPEIAAQVIAASDDTFDFRKVSEQVHRDQALAGHVLRIANSVAIAGNIKIVSLQQALVRLGTRRVKELVVAVVMKTRIFQSNRFSKCAEVIWKEAAATSFFAKEIARHLRSNTEGAFLCGLLHTVGKPVVLHSVTELAKKNEWDLDEAVVNQVIEEFYVTAGERLVRPWSLPASVAEAIRCHQRPADAVQFRETVAIVSVARCIAEALINGANARELAEIPDYSTLHLYPDDVEQILRHVESARTYIEILSEA